MREVIHGLSRRKTETEIQYVKVVALGRLHVASVITTFVWALGSQEVNEIKITIMPSRRNNRKPAIRTTAFLENNRTNTRSRGTIEAYNSQASFLNAVANDGREGNGRMMRKADKNRIKATARQLRKDGTLRGNEYRQGTKEEVRAQHNARYRALRTAFGMSAG